LHPTLVDQTLHVLSVPLGPTASRSSWRDPLEVGFAIDGLLDAIDPTPAQRFNNNLSPTDAWFARLHFEYLDPKFIFGGMVCFEPLTQLFR
jgi:hypothetical protein